MNLKALADELDKQAEKAASKLGVRASVKLKSTDGSDENPGGPQVELVVFRKASDEVRELSATFRPDRQDLKSVIEQQIAVMASQLGGTK